MVEFNVSFTATVRVNIDEAVKDQIDYLADTGIDVSDLLDEDTLKRILWRAALDIYLERGQGDNIQIDSVEYLGEEN